MWNVQLNWFTYSMEIIPLVFSSMYFYQMTFIVIFHMYIYYINHQTVQVRNTTTIAKIFEQRQTIFSGVVSYLLQSIKIEIYLRVLGLCSMQVYHAGVHGQANRYEGNIGSECRSKTLPPIPPPIPPTPHSPSTYKQSSRRADGRARRQRRVVQAGHCKTPNGYSILLQYHQ